jgi:hypothetical protein
MLLALASAVTLSIQVTARDFLPLFVLGVGFIFSAKEPYINSFSFTAIILKCRQLK